MTNHSESIGPEVRHAGSGRSAATGKPSPEAMRQLMTDTIASQFATLGEAAENCDVIVAAGALRRQPTVTASPTTTDLTATRREAFVVDRCSVPAPWFLGLANRLLITVLLFLN